MIPAQGIRMDLIFTIPGTSCVDIYDESPMNHGRSGDYVLEIDHFFFAIVKWN